MDKPVTHISICRPPIVPDNWLDGVFPIDKPSGITSFDVLRQLKRILGKVKMGHAGTLDPMATGLLICLIGRATKQMNTFLEMPKEYTGRVRLGETTASYDADTPVISNRESAHITDDMIRKAAAHFEGTIRQLTPMYSAVRVGGERLYKKARRGETVTTPTRDVTIYSFVTEPVSHSEFAFTLRCSKGTYVRSVAHDMGQILGVGAHLVSLRRTQIGDVDVEHAWRLDALSEAVNTRQASIEH